MFKKIIPLALALVALTSCQGTWLLIPSTGLRQSVVTGGQSAIDAGNVVDITGWCGPGPRWFAGHRSTHGSVFASLPRGLKVGNHVVVYENGQAKDYVVTSITHDYDCDGAWGDALIQTSHPNGGVYFWHLTRD